MAKEGKCPGAPKKAPRPIPDLWINISSSGRKRLRFDEETPTTPTTPDQPIRRNLVELLRAPKRSRRRINFDDLPPTPTHQPIIVDEDEVPTTPRNQPIRRDPRILWAPKKSRRSSFDVDEVPTTPTHQPIRRDPRILWAPKKPSKRT